VQGLKKGFMMKRKPEIFLEIKWLDAKKGEDLKEAYHVRCEVFIKEQKVPEEEEIDEADLKAHHVVIYENFKPIATGRLFRDGKTWLIGRISVLKDYREKQVGKLVVEKLLEKAAELRAEEVHVHAQILATGFYRKSGFVAYGDIFLESGIEHVSMLKKLYPD
jgi:predicted GNAT family N-acyltransferase